jgi:hypothetical protein
MVSPMTLSADETSDAVSCQAAWEIFLVAAGKAVASS